MESFFSCASFLSFLSSGDLGFARIGLVPDSLALGPALLPAPARTLIALGGASSRGIGVGLDAVGHMSSVFNPEQGSVPGGGGGEWLSWVLPFVDTALQDGMMLG